MKHIVIFIYLLIFSLCTYAQEIPNCYRLYLTDKTGTPFSIDKPEEFLSPRSIAKRTRFNIAISEEDLPINPNYIRQILSIDSNIQVLSQSKWTNTLTIYCPQKNALDSILNLSFVNIFKPVAHYTPKKDTLSVKPTNLPISTYPGKSTPATWTPEQYGSSYAQIAIHNGDQLHAAGFRGEGMLIAVIDAGWKNFNQLPCFKPLFDNGQIVGTRNLLPGRNDLYNTNEIHGSYVTSIMATSIPGTLIGSAPEASYFFICSENSDSEEPIEEDLWMMAAEIADSIGADIINSSLGYTIFNDSISYPSSYNSCDGTSLISQVAAKAVEKGIIVCVSAGNEGGKAWKHIGRPADAHNVLTIGAISIDSLLASFSSIGPSYDNRIKPDVVSVGWNAAIIDTIGNASTSNGTSFSSPLMAGLTACLWQSLPDKSAAEIIQIIKENSHLASNPNFQTGYGIPDIYQAYNKHTGIRTILQDALALDIYPNPCTNSCSISTRIPFHQVQIKLYNTFGQLLLHNTNIDLTSTMTLNLSSLQKGVYLLHLSGVSELGEQLTTFKKIIKQ